jgi:hypothetical protein
MKKGSILEYKRAGGLFYHYGMYIGDDKVIHRDKGTGVIITGLDDMIGEMRIVSPKCHRVPTEQAIHTAFEIKDGEYNPITKNCEHFVNFVRYRKKSSRQVRKFFYFGGYIACLILGKHHLL